MSNTGFTNVEGASHIAPETERSGESMIIDQDLLGSRCWVLD